MSTVHSGLSRDQVLSTYGKMTMIRAFEERLHADFAAGTIPGAVHLYAGQEAIAVGTCAHLNDDDYIASTHRGHGHAIAKGCDVTAMMLEIYGRRDGICGGKGGSMHIADFSHGMLGANGVAAGGVPMVCGAALSAKLLGTDRVAIAFLGDGAANQGAFAESMNLAGVWHLPCVFVVENNGYAQATGVAYHLRGLSVAQRAQAYGLPGTVVDGVDFFAVYDAVGAAVQRARSGGGPSLVECLAPRFFGHMEGFDQQGYRHPDEVRRERAERDCLTRFAARVVAAATVDQATLDALDRSARAEVARAAAVASGAADPHPDDLVAGVYAIPAPAR